MTLKRVWPAFDAKNNMTETTTIGIGKHEMERIPNPLGYKNAPWLVLKGTLIGATESSWRQWTKNSDNPEGPLNAYPIFEITIEE